MNIIKLSRREYNRLKPYLVSKYIIHTEADLYEMNYCGERKIVKTMFTYDKIFHKAKLNTLEALDTYKSYLPESFCTPDNLIAVGRRKPAFTAPFFNGETLSSILKNPSIPVEEHIYYLVKVGEILEELSKTRRTTSLKDIYMGDLHESNIMVNIFTKQLGIVDLDSCRIGSRFSYTAKYLTPFSLLKTQPDKYEINQIIGNGPGYIVPDQNSDIYCYIVMILNYITGNIFKYFTVDNFYDYLNLLSNMGINPNLLYLIEKIVTKDDNINPYEYLRNLTTQDIQTTKEAALTIIKKR